MHSPLYCEHDARTTGDSFMHFCSSSADRSHLLLDNRKCIGVKTNTYGVFKSGLPIVLCCSPTSFLSLFS